jgi:hypothetical protein
MGIAVTQSALEKIYQEVLGTCKDRKEFLWKHRGRFVHYIQAGVAKGLLDERFTRKHFRLERLSYALDPLRDELLSDATVSALAQSHLLQNDGKILETPQYYWMHRAMTQALGEPNPTRAALELYDNLSKEAQLPAANWNYPADIFNNQRLLFDTTRPTRKAGAASVPEHYYKHGWIVLDKVIENEFEAIQRQEDFINSIDDSKLPTHQRFHDRIQLAKADQIPVCDDIVATSFQVLHFDMGHPLLESEGQLFVSHVGIYLPKTTNHEVTARTRLVELEGLLKHFDISPEEIEQKVIAYVREYGDGWIGHNTYRLACFIRFLDAQSSRPELQDQIDKTVGQWFENENKLDEASAHDEEVAFYASHGIDLSKLEHQIELKPGQLLILDNTRVVHGRIGKRRTKELFNFMWGVEAILPDDITALRQYICRILV